MNPKYKTIYYYKLCTTYSNVINELPYLYQWDNSSVILKTDLVLNENDTGLRKYKIKEFEH